MTATLDLHLPGGIHIRPLQLSDAPAMSKGADNLKIARWMRNTFPSPYTEQHAIDYIKMMMNQDSWAPRSVPNVPTTLPPAEAAKKIPVSYGITLDGVLVGSVGFKMEDDTSVRTAILGYWIAENYWGRGLAPMVSRAVVDWAWGAFPYLVRVEAGVYEGNPQSERVLAKIGFEKEFVWKAKIWKEGKVKDLNIWAVYSPDYIRQRKAERGEELPSVSTTSEGRSRE